MHAVREWARATKPHVARPAVVVPYSAHPAFTKAGHYLGLDVRRVPLGSDYRAAVAAMAAAISPDTVALVGSAPTWPHGLYDPIGDLAELAQQHDLWMHVDACVGGYFAPFARKLGVPLPDWDLSVPGVCSLSADLHKWGYAPEPCSTVLYRTAELYAYQPFPVSEWPGGAYATDGVTGSRPGGPIAAAWAIFHYLGEAGYLEIAQRTLAVKQRLSDGIEAIPGLRPWDTDLVILVYESTDPMLDIRAVAAGLRSRGWANMGTQEPPLLHLSCDAVPDDVVDTYLADLRAVVDEVRAGRHAVDDLAYV
jgi:glutamate/tyrosine decarboxylase-like PLP-dependent enzyme